ncbi:amino acid ABC transporter permease [Pseudomonas putida]|uniref:amino acid ABC transporter permease n=1 Tax=Pseudomonas putida TaxID=303 RepID=UPI00236446E7|nr:amino acid ABC transporter permease [Pseudomonas putida]MDD2002076.1 amino acid ABC transporter permease [Pseudomonas putida]
MRDIGINDFFLLWEGLKWTVMLSVIAFIGGGVGGLAIALCRTSRVKVLNWISGIYIEVFQGTPLLLQLFVVYYGVALLNLDISAWVAAAIGLTLHASAYLAEIWRGCIQAIPLGQHEAARALGLSTVHRSLDVILPQAFKISLPPTVGFLVGLIKGTSLTAIIGFTELTRAGQVVSNNTFQPLAVFAIVGVLYFCICWPLSLWSDRLEKKTSLA